MKIPNWKWSTGAALAFGVIVGGWTVYNQIHLPDANQFPNWSSSSEVAFVPATVFYSPTEDEKRQILQKFGLNSFLPTEQKSDVELLKGIVNWASSRWQHVGDNMPGTTNPIQILEQAKSGKRFRCVEFAEISVAAASVVELPARVLKLRRKDVETAESDAGHIAAEVWLRDQRKWVFVDSQWGLIPMLNGTPLSVTELTSALKEHNPHLTFYSAKSSKSDLLLYPAWVAPYLFFIEYEIDQRLNVSSREKDRISLTPVGVAAPKYFQREKIPGNVTQISDAQSFQQNPVSRVSN